MLFWHSGIKNNFDAQILRSADVRRVMVNDSNLHLATNFPCVVRDSPAYKVFKQGGTVNPIAYLESAFQHPIAGRQFEWISAPDVIGHPEQTYVNWQVTKEWVKDRYGSFDRLPAPIIPIWGWGTDLEPLKEYLRYHPLIGIGGLVPLMRQGKSDDKEERREAHAMLKTLEKLCRQYPGRFHIYGLNWVIAINKLHPYLASADSSISWDGARYAKLILDANWINPELPSQLVRVKARDLGYEGDRAGRCRICARSIERFLSRAS